MSCTDDALPSIDCMGWPRLDVQPAPRNYLPVRVAGGEESMSRHRLHDDGFLAYLRTLPCCCGCNRAAPSEAAHIRIGFFAMGKKPDDCNAVPLNAWCHRKAPD